MSIDYREKALEFIRLRGPCVPVQLGKHMGMNSMLAGALLSELVSKGSLRISNLKMGGSPLYFVPGQEPELLKHLDLLQDVDRQTVQLLERHRVIRDNEASPLIRVSLRNIADFAVPLDVSYNQQKETFWKWFLCPDEETQRIIKGMLQPVKAPERPAPVPEQTVLQHVDGTQEAVQQEVQRAPSRPAPVRTPAAESRAEVGERPDMAGDPFLASLLAFFVKNNIKIVEQQCVKKRVEYDFVLKLPSGVGTLTYYCKAKAKRKVTDGDVSSAFVQGQLRKLPVVLLATGELNKKGQEMVERDLQGLTFKQIGEEQ